MHQQLTFIPAPRILQNKAEVTLNYTTQYPFILHSFDLTNTFQCVILGAK